MRTMALLAVRGDESGSVDLGVCPTVDPVPGLEGVSRGVLMGRFPTMLAAALPNNLLGSCRLPGFRVGEQELEEPPS
jgi:hypothetical protein